MNPEHPFARIRRLFDAASGVPAAERAQYLAHLGAAPEEIAEVLAMLAAAGQETAGLRAAAVLPAAVFDTDHPLPRRFGPFVLRREIGRGGMGVVYEAEDTATGDVMALKRIRGEGVHPTARDRFVREARLGAAIDDPHCVFVRSGGTVDGDLFLTMELLSGDNLRYLVERRGPLPIDETRTRMLEVCRGLEALHAADIVHRDLKPENCLLTDDGHVKVGDLGLSRTLAPMSLHLTGPHQMLGTPAFAAPEQLRGDPVDVRTDVYAATATLFFLLSGQPPFVGTDYAQLIARVVADPVPSLRERGVAASMALEQLVERGLAKDPGERFGSIADLVAAIEAAMQGRLPIAPAGQRLAAIVADLSLLFLLAAGVHFAVEDYDLLACTWQSVFAGDPTWLLVLLAAVAYFSLTEGFGGASLGKRWVGLRVVRAPAGGRPGLGRAAARAALVALVFSLNEPAAALLDVPLPNVWILAVWMPVSVVLTVGLPFLLLFPPRRGWRPEGLRDRWFGTSVVVAAEALHSMPGARVDSPRPRTMAGHVVEIDPFLARQVLVVDASTMLHAEFSPRVVDRSHRAGRDALLLATPLGWSWEEWLDRGCGTWTESCAALLALARALAWQPIATSQLVVGLHGTLRVLPPAAEPPPPTTLAEAVRQVISARGFAAPWSVRGQLLAAAEPGGEQRLVDVLQQMQGRATVVRGTQRFRCSLASSALFVALVLAFYVLQMVSRAGRVEALDRGLQLAELIQQVANAASTRETFAAMLQQQGRSIEATVAEAAEVCRRLAPEVRLRLRDGQRSLLMPFEPTGRELTELGSMVFFFAPREERHHESLLRKWDDWRANKSPGHSVAESFRSQVALFPIAAGLCAALLGMFLRGRWPFRWVGLTLIDARGRDLSRRRAAWHASFVFVPVSLLVLLAEWVDTAFVRGTLLCAVVYWAIFIGAIVYPLLAFRMPVRMPHDLLVGTRVVAR